jgi:response regulator RpfG family c-di-GMP phosphodiesterase
MVAKHSPACSANHARPDRAGHHAARTSTAVALCRAVREFSEVPIIMVTAKVQEIDRLLGLEIGADDYLCKPFSPRELVARIKAILRRSHKPDNNARLIDINEAERSVRIGSQLLDLTPTEYSLLAAMTKRPGHHLSRGHNCWTWLAATPWTLPTARSTATSKICAGNSPR